MGAGGGGEDEKGGYQEEIGGFLKKQIRSCTRMGLRIREEGRASTL